MALERRTFLKSLAGAATAPAILSAKARRPNIILMMADDMGYSDIGCYGSEIATPNLNRLAGGGMRFTQFYNCARCCPTRASLLTGLYPHQAGVGHMVDDRKLPGYRGELSRNAVTIAEALRPAGYRTLMTGKWHVTVPRRDHPENWPLQRGFERFYGTIASGWNYFNPTLLTEGNEEAKPGPGQFYYTDAIGDRASAWIREYAAGKDPYFMYVAFPAPHWPLHALPEDIAKYASRYRTGWDQLRTERHGRQIAQGIVKKQWRLTDRDPQVPAWKDAENKEWLARCMAVYAAQIDRMDQNVGKILAAIDKGGAENTLVLFLSDNGGCAEVLRRNMRGALMPKATRSGGPIRTGNDPSITPGTEDTYSSYGVGWANASNTPFRLYKHWVHEGGIATPLIARWPGVIKRQNAVEHQYGHLIDIMATCVDVAGARYPEVLNGNKITPLEGHSLMPVLEGGKRPPAELFWEHEGNRAVRRGQWKLVAKHHSPWELYDLDADRTETRDLAPEHAGRVSEFAANYQRWADRSNVVPWEKVDTRTQ